MMFPDKPILTLADVAGAFPLRHDDDCVGPYIVDPLYKANQPLPESCRFCPHSTPTSESVTETCLRKTQLRTPFTEGQEAILSRVAFPRTNVSAPTARFNAASNSLHLADGRVFLVPAILFTATHEVAPHAEPLYRHIIPSAAEWCHDPSMHRLELKHVDVHCYEDHELPELKDGNFFTQKFNEFLMFDLEYDMDYDDMYSQAYIRCLMFCRIFHPTLNASQQYALADRYYLTTEVSKIEPE